MAAAQGSRARGLTRAGFVRGLSLDVPVEEVIKLAKKQGLAVKASDVHAARHYMRKRAEPIEAPARRGRPRQEDQSVELTFKQSAIRMGFDRAQAILDQMKRGLENLH